MAACCRCGEIIDDPRNEVECDGCECPLCLGCYLTDSLCPECDGTAVSKKASTNVGRKLRSVLKTQSRGARLITKERQRQIEVEGFNHKHDDAHIFGELARAAAVYAMGTRNIFTGFPRGPSRRCPSPTLTNIAPVWPFSQEYDKRKKHSRIRQLEIAGALIAAEIDRLLRGGHTK
jgi:hypothetical protein